PWHRRGHRRARPQLRRRRPARRRRSLQPLMKQLDDIVLEVSGLSTWFETGRETVKAVEDVSLTLHRGKTLCVVGESGSGKSVTARSILRSVPRPGRIVGGRILLRRTDLPWARGEAVDIAQLDPKGRRIRDIRGREIAMIFQEPMSSLSPVHTIGRQIV